MNVEISRDVDINMTAYEGQFDMSYAALCALIGPPTEMGSGDDKVDVTWQLKFGDGTIASIYNYKDGPAYTGEGSIEDLTDWHIGGHNSRAADLVLELVNSVKTGAGAGQFVLEGD